jgi:hypothetical protein
MWAQRYSDWAQQQVDRADRTLNPKAQLDRLALAEYYLGLAEKELAAAKGLEPQSGHLQLASLPIAATATNSNDHATL